jgi:hypothetical protein
MSVIVSGPDEYGIADALEAEGIAVTRVDIANRETLEEADVAAAEAYVLTEVAQATSIPVAKEANEGLRVLVYADGSLADFARPQADLVLDPDLFDPADVATEV